MTQSTLIAAALPPRASLPAAVRNELFPRRSPEDLRRQHRITKALRTSGHRALATVRCEVSGSLAVLSGAVSSYYLKQLAQVAALQVDGVRMVENLIEVR
jgi:osmotically-inducible protein OsmY